MDCAVGQIDLNHASVEDLQRLPGVSQPIAARIISSRPNDRVDDLLVVPGIGDGKLASIRASQLPCSTPLTLPPPAPDVCTSPAQIDANNPASELSLAQLFGAPTAQRVVLAQPFSDLSHLRTVLVPGAGQGKVDKYATRLCVTPVPKVSSGINYSWAYSATGGRADFDGFSLIVPPHVLNTTVGQWLKIAPQSTPTPDLPGLSWPSADFSILGSPWQDGGESVFVTLPTDPGLASFKPGWEPIVAHWDDPTRTSGEEISGMSLLVNGTTPSVTAAVTHLSVVDSLSRGVSWVAEPLLNVTADARFPAPSCDVAWTLDPSTGDWSRDGARVHLDSAYLNLPNSPVPPLGYPLKHCVESDFGNANATLRILNNTRTIQSLTNYAGNPILGSSSIGGDLLQLSITKAGEAVFGHPFAYPGAEVTASVAQGSFAAVQMRPNLALTGLWAALDQSPLEDLVKKIPTVGPVAAAIGNIANCVLTLPAITSLSASSTPQQVMDAIKGGLSSCFSAKVFWDIVAEAVKTGVISGGTANTLSNALNELSRYDIWLRVGQVVVSGGDAIAGWAGGSSAGIISIEHYAPKPVFDSQGRPVHSACLQARGYGWILDPACQDAFYYPATHPPSGSGGIGALPGGLIIRDPSSGHASFWNADDSTLRPIEDGGTYLCLARHYAVDWAPDFTQYRGTIVLSPPASCTDTTDTRGIQPGSTSLQGTATILRQADGTAWVVYDSVHRFHIPTGAEFMCWVSPQTDRNIKFYVWDQVLQGQIDLFPVDPAVTLISNCGDPAHPGF